MKKPRYKYYWFGIVLKIVKSYYDIRADDSPQSRYYCEAIEKALEKTLEYKNGVTRVKAVTMAYMDKSHRMIEVGESLGYSERQIKRFCEDFVYLVAEISGFKMAHDAEKENV